MLASIMDVRSKPAVTKAKSVAAEMRRRRETSEAAAVAREQAVREREMATAISNEKEKRPWPIKVGPYDSTPKRPQDGKVRHGSWLLGVGKNKARVDEKGAAPRGGGITLAHAIRVYVPTRQPTLRLNRVSSKQPGSTCG